METDLKTFFTMRRRTRYACVMLLVVAAAIAASPPPAVPTRNAGASVQATATVRIISGVRLSFGAVQSDTGVPRPRQTVVHTADAQEQPVTLFEFE